MICPDHNEEQVWIELSPGRKVLRCQSCHDGKVSLNKKQRVDMPHIKYGQNFHRERPWNETEKRSQFGKAKRPQY